ncbi:MAG: glycosyltransferase family 2 protein [Parvibaculum sp.]|uniref:glycosyltransferase family 2 protein n=1 Tax=Parvibaculum sp. TaxID=2024848 RepID=UPI0032ED7A2B
MKKLDTLKIPSAREEIRLFLVGRDEGLRLPFLIEHYRLAGVDRFFVVDNGSTDGMTDFLLSQKDVHVFYTEDSYKENKAGVSWVNQLLDQYGVGHWCLVVDADEILVYPYSDILNIKELCIFLDRVEAVGLFCLMIDMYPRGALKNADYAMGQPFLDIADHFDAGPYNVFPARNFPHLQIKGGMRRRVFWANGRNADGPALNKIPLVKWRRGMAFAGSTHTLRPALALAPITGVLQHFKYFSDFAVTAVREYARNDRPHIDEYRLYAEMLEREPAMSFMCDVSVRYRDPVQLVELGLLKGSWELKKFVEERFSACETEGSSLDATSGAMAEANRYKVPLSKALQLLPIYGF